MAQIIKVQVSFDPKTERLLERVAKAIEKQQNVNINVQSPEHPPEESSEQSG